MNETDIELRDGRVLHVYDTRADVADVALTVFWHHGTPNTGDPPGPLLEASARRGIGWVSHDRPGYGGSTRHPGRNIASVAADVAAIADALAIKRFAVMGHSGGGPHALACAALLPERVTCAASVSGLAPIDAAGLDWFAGMAGAGAAELHAAETGAAALETLLTTTAFDPEQFTPADHAALAGDWGWLGMVAGKGQRGGFGGMVDDDVAYVGPWGFHVASVRAPVLLLHGGQDRVVPSSHAAWLSRRIPSSELWARPDDGHISVLGSAVAALDWVKGHA